MNQEEYDEIQSENYLAEGEPEKEQDQDNKKEPDNPKYRLQKKEELLWEYHEFINTSDGELFKEQFLKDHPEFFDYLGEDAPAERRERNKIPGKKKKRKFVFNEFDLKNPMFKEWLSKDPNNVEKGYCKWCAVSITLINLFINDMPHKQIAI